jgi:NADH-quinone oxidoreductase subunit M
MGESLVLNLLLWLPVIGTVLLFVMRGSASAARLVTLGVMVLQLIIAAWLYSRFDASVGGLQFATSVPWIPQWGVSYLIGLDGFNILLVALTAFLGPVVVLGAHRSIDKDVTLFHAMVLLLQFAMMGAFLAQDLFLFYLFWEAMLIPMFLIIGIWGGTRRIYATVKFFLYTAFGSILMLAALIYLVQSLAETSSVTSFAFADLYRARLPLPVQTILLGAFALSFAIKVPMVPVILAGVLLKMGTYGFMKLGFPLFPDAARVFTPALMTLAVISVVYGACLALVQTDIKKIIAYSSISHLGYVMLGLLSLELVGIQGAIIQMVSHGLVAAGLFLLVGMIYERCHTRELSAYGGLARLLPVFSLLGAFNAAWPLHVAGQSYPLILASLAVLGVILGALYMLRFALTFLFGAVNAPHQPLTDLSVRERGILGALVIAIFALGLFPDGAMRKTEQAAREYQTLVKTSRLPELAP